jgi:hypothetical protein
MIRRTCEYDPKQQPNLEIRPVNGLFDESGKHIQKSSFRPHVFFVMTNVISDIGTLSLNNHQDRDYHICEEFASPIQHRQADAAPSISFN